MKRVIVIIATVILALGGIAAGYLLVMKHRGADVVGSSSEEFIATESPATIPSPGRTRAREGGTPWPTYGRDARRQRAVAGLGRRPPYTVAWTFHGRTLLEFPPAVAYGRVFIPTFDGRLYALDARTGTRRWSYASGGCGWGSPAVAHHVVFITFLGHHPCSASEPGTTGVVIAFAERTGKALWRTRIGPTESSPLVVGDLVYVGDWNGDVVALDRRTGKLRWTYRTGGRVKSSAAYADGRIFIGSYDGHVYALGARSGRLAWRASAQPRIGSHGTFYSTPAVAYGRVFIGSTDGKVYAYGQRSGRLLWSHSTGGYVYASPAVWRTQILIGSYDESFYSLDAATGEERWRFRANGPISGAASVIDGIVYFSTFALETYALNSMTGTEVWRFPDGKYSPAVADSHRLYLVGEGRLYGMTDRGR